MARSRDHGSWMDRYLLEQRMKVQYICLQKKLGEWTFESFFFLAIFSGIKEYLKKIVESELSEPNKIQQQFPENKRY